MKYKVAFILVYSFCEIVFASSTCQSIAYRRKNTITFRCSELTQLQANLDRAKTNTTHIAISNSNVPNIPGHAFARFGKTLVSLDLHESGIQSVDSQAFIGLTVLETLLLWGNQLMWVPGDWFATTYKLKTLDVSFNFIQGIDYPVLQMLPLLENFYFDYNQLTTIDFSMFAYMYNLKRVKFGKNPWRWPYRARLTWQMENQRVDYVDDWEEWSWMSTVIKDCIETGESEMPSDKVLDCAVQSLLEFARDNLNPARTGTPNYVGCDNEAKRLIRCMRPINDSTANTDYTTARMILQDYAAILPNIQRAQSPFTISLQ